MVPKIEDSAVKDALRGCRNGERGACKLVKEMVSHYVYNFPRIVFGADPDGCGAFYEYVLERLEGILANYRESQVKFITWFTVVLRNRYLNFVRERRSSGRIESQIRILSLDGDAGRAGGHSGGMGRRGYCGKTSQDGSSLNLHEAIGDDRYGIEESDREYEELVDGIVKNLRENQRVFFHLYFIESIRPEDLGFLSIYLNRTVSDLLGGIRAVRTSLEDKYRVKGRLYRRLAGIYFEILRGQREGLADLVRRSKKKREKVLDEYRRVKLNPSYESIARFLGLPIGTVSTGIMRMKKAVERYLKESERERVPVS